MPKIKAYDISAETSPATAPTATTTTAVAPAPSTELAATPPGMGSVVGDIDSSDITVPRLNIVQGVGSLAELFNPGEIVLNQETVLSNGSTPVELTVLSARKQFVENLGFDEDARPKVFDTLEEIHAAGGTIEWIGDTRPSYVPVLHVQLVLKAPAGVEGAFPLCYNGEDYALAVWTLRGVAYGKAGRNILTAAKFALRDGLHNGKWTLTTKREKYGRNSVFVPVLRNVGRNAPEFVDYLRTLG